MRRKILSTILTTVAIALTLQLFAKFIIGFIIMDDDLMMISSFMLVSLASLVFLLEYFTFVLVRTWKKNKKRKKQNEKRTRNIK